MAHSPIMTNPQRALQLWSLLALAAITRTILTYEEVAELTGLPNNSGHVLGHILFYCQQNNLPLLSSLVVDKETGRPPLDIYGGKDQAEHRRCFSYDWLKHGVPSPGEFATAYERGKAA